SSSGVVRAVSSASRIWANKGSCCRNSRLVTLGAANVVVLVPSTKVLKKLAGWTSSKIGTTVQANLKLPSKDSAGVDNNSPVRPGVLAIETAARAGWMPSFQG